MSLLLLSLLGVGLIAYVFDVLDDDGDADPEAEDMSEIDAEILSNQTTEGTAGDDTLTGGGVENADVSAGAGDDFILFQGQDSTIDGGAGNDTIAGLFESPSTGADASGSIITGGDGDDSISGLSEVGMIDGGEGNDTIAALYSNINGGAGDDLIQGGGYYATIEGGAGNDTIVADGDVDFVFGGDGDDDLSVAGWGFEQSSTDGGDGDDTISVAISDLPIFQSGNAISNLLNGGEGADVFDYTISATLPFDPGTLSGSEINAGVIGIVEDFTPGEDVLVINTPQTGATGNELLGYTVEEDSGGAYTDVILRYGYASDPSFEQIASIRLIGATGVSSDTDIRVVDTALAAA